MDREKLEKLIKSTYEHTAGNTVGKDSEPLFGKEGLKLFEEPIFGIGSAEDPLFENFKTPGIVGPWYMTPAEWMREAKSVVSIFFPFSERVKRSNAAQKDGASLEWAYARIEGQAFIAAFLENLASRLSGKGIKTCVPSADGRFFTITAGKPSESYPGEKQGDFYPGTDINTFSSTWSERHAAFVCGLGTFGKSRGIITEKGMAGRLGSIILSEKIPADERPYKEIYEYCIGCNACVKRCPAGAIPQDGVQEHLPCAARVVKSKEELAPRYGCGLCQTGVPCESRIPKK